MSESLFAGSTVRLFGHKFVGLTLEVENGGAHTPIGAPSVLRLLQEQLRIENGGTPLTPGLARIYGFSYLGAYHKLAEPTVLLVFGDGDDVPPATQVATLGVVGVEFKGETFSGAVKVWAQDRADYSVRIDITPGWLADVLVAPGMSEGTNMTTGQAPETDRSNPMGGRARMVGRACMVGRGGCD